MKLDDVGDVVRFGKGFGLLGAFSSLVACAPEPPLAAATPILRWVKPGASYDHFMLDRYVCAQESTRQVSTSRMGSYGGSSQSTSIVSVSMFQACMGARGWRQSPDGYAPPAGEYIVMN